MRRPPAQGYRQATARAKGFVFQTETTRKALDARLPLDAWGQRHATPRGPIFSAQEDQRGQRHATASKGLGPESRDARQMAQFFFCHRKPPRLLRLLGTRDARQSLHNKVLHRKLNHKMAKHCKGKYCKRKYSKARYGIAKLSI